MPRFRTIDEAIRYQLERVVSPPDAPLGTGLSVGVGQHQSFTGESDHIPGVLRWGFSTWGVESVIGIDKPKDRK